MINLNSVVEIISLKEYGKILNIRMDSNSCPIYTVGLDWGTIVTPDGLFVARDCELKEIVCNQCKKEPCVEWSWFNGQWQWICDTCYIQARAACA
jgi:hypothetical protein